MTKAIAPSTLTIGRGMGPNAIWTMIAKTPKTTTTTTTTTTTSSSKADDDDDGQPSTTTTTTTIILSASQLERMISDQVDVGRRRRRRRQQQQPHGQPQQQQQQQDEPLGYDDENYDGYYEADHDDNEDDFEDEDEDDILIHFSTRYDQHYLKCQLPYIQPPTMTVLGLYEDEGGEGIWNQLSIHLTHYYYHCPNVEEKDSTTSTTPPSLYQWSGPHSEWIRSSSRSSAPYLNPEQRSSFSIAKEEELFHDDDDDDDDDNNRNKKNSPAAPVLPYHVRWIHLEDHYEQPSDMLVSNMEEAWYFLSSLLGSYHHPTDNPWAPPSNENDNDNDDSGSSCHMPDMVLLQMSRPTMTTTSTTKKKKNILQTFRVSDACPSWFLHGYAYLRPSDDDNDNDDMNHEKKETILYIYKRLKPRIHLFHQHPEDGTIPTPEGCLWERVPVTSSPDDDEDEYEDDEDHDQTHPNNNNNKMMTYRIISPPYLNLEQEYGTKIATQLFSKGNLNIFRSEALNIPQWTPWPETQHYSVGLNGEIKWTVFPLCYCFPAHDITQRTWVTQTKECCPQTCQILESILGDTLRTALYSQLHPETILEAHTGWADLANSVLRLHIPLIMPSTIQDGLCGTWVDGCIETHQIGRPILFDDSKIHRAFNYSSSGTRIVLIVDLVRPTTLPWGYATGGHSEELDAFISQMTIPK